MRQDVISKIEEIVRRVADSEGIEVIQVELKGGGANQLLRISIDKPEGVTHADCENISQQVGTILDVEDIVPGRYTLEVSSPGVERPLLKEKDFERFRGKKVKILLREPIDNQRQLEGTLDGISEGVITVQPGARKAGQAPAAVRFRFDQVQRANLKFEW
jgi:ribosome maturation factor RimP